MELNGTSNRIPDRPFSLSSNDFRGKDISKTIEKLIADLSPDISNELWHICPITSFKRMDSIAKKTNMIGYSGSAKTQGFRFIIKFPETMTKHDSSDIRILIKNSVDGTKIVSRVPLTPVQKTTYLEGI